MTNFLYNPDRKTKVQLMAEFVVRTDVLNEIMHDIETSEMKRPEQHYLLVGQRGSGKTTMLNRIKYAVEDADQLNNWLIPVIFSEEQYNITELVNLWENIAQVLEDYHGFDGIVEEMERHVQKEDFEEKAYEVLEKKLRLGKKKLLLLIDNIGDFLKKLDDTEVRRLREILQSKPDIRIVAGSSFYLESILDYKQPLFEFFKVIRLEGLSAEETRTLLRMLGQVYNETDKIEKIIREKPDRIDTLRVLTGGVPRTIALMFSVFVDYEHESSLRDLERILDAVTPLYKHRMDDLSTQQQKIMDAVAKHWDPVSVKQLTSSVRLESKVLSAQLRQLEKNQVIEKIETGSKNHLYQVKERFFNIWYLMRYGRKYDRMRVVWLVKFMENWCDSAEIESRVRDYVSKIKEGQLDESSIDFYGQVYTAFDNLDPKIRLLLKAATPPDISAEVNLSFDEHKQIFLDLIKAKKWDDALEAARFLEMVDDDVKAVLRAAIALMGTFSRKFRSLKVIQDKMVNTPIENGLVPVKLHPGEWFILLLFLEYALGVNIFVSSGNLAKNIRTYVRVNEALQNHLSDVDFQSLNYMVMALLASKYYNFAAQLFDSDILQLKERLKPTYYCLLYLRDGNRPAAGSELYEPVAKVEEQVNKLAQYLLNTQAPK